MNLGLLKNHITTAIKERNIALIMAIIMGIGNLLLIINMITNKERIVVVPAYSHQGFWVEKAQVSKEYLEQMSLFFIENLLNLTADSIAYQKDVILKHVDPEFYAQLKNDSLTKSKDTKKNV